MDNINLAIKTDLQAFNYVKKMLLEQNQRSSSPYTSCAYRGYSEKLEQQFTNFLEENNVSLDVRHIGNYTLSVQYTADLKCAAGFLISDNVYHKDLETREASDVRVVDAIQASNLLWKMTDNSITMTLIMQIIHDIVTPNHWDRIFNSDCFKFDNNGNFVGVYTDIYDVNKDLYRWIYDYQQETGNDCIFERD